ncbi:MAG: F0F1 ATP synthase subunit A [Candidatus Coatesbacteria bacterium]|nr:MAG: F0F1 ATP synthase subunit A [Candidatus Coatesbacteria bacterium]
MDELRVGLEWGLPLPGLHHHATVIVSNAILVAVVVLVGFYVICRRAKLKPSLPQMILELVVETGRHFLRDIGGPKIEKYLPFCLSLFLFILVGNLFGMIPGFVAPTTNMAVNAAMALCVFVMTFYVGIKELGIKKYFLHKTGPFAGMAKIAFIIGGPIFILLESVGEFARPLSLTIRLFGNIFGEEQFVMVVNNIVTNVNVLFPALNMEPFIEYFMAVTLMPVFYALVAFTSFLQAFIFAFLPILYFGAAVGWGEEDH